jgi:hypothetical protein
MIEKISDLPGNVLGFTASGKVTADDYESVLVPAVEQKLTEQKKIRLLYHLDDDFTGYEAGAMWDDTKIGLKHLTAWERIAVVTDVDWIRTSVKVFGFAMPGHVRVFEISGLAEAKAWLSE